MAILKAGAYGHGMENIAISLENLPSGQAPDFFGVASVIEARRLTSAGIQTRIYLLGPTSPVEREEIIARQWIPSISSLDEAAHFNQLASQQKHPSAPTPFPTPFPIHLTVDTGMGRGGFLPKDLPEIIHIWANFPHLIIEGIGSHLPSADEDKEFTNAQFEQFDSLVESMGIHRFQYRHLANSAGLLAYQSRTTNLYRPGLMLYGISPLPAFQKQLKPVMTLKSRVSLVRTLPAGQGISYGRDAILDQESSIATIGIGYGDGYPHALSGKGAEVLIRNTRCPVIGRVTMDQIMVNVSHLPDCVSGDEVELFGKNILVSELANLANTIPWAILTGITPRVTRLYISRS
jgi:alanine racemase